MTRANVGIVTAYNDMLSAHQPYHQGYPDIIRARWPSSATAPRSPAACPPCATV